MEQILRSRADKLISIYDQVSKDYRWKNSNNMNNLIALSYVMKDKVYKRSDIDRVNEYIKRNTSPFSCYRQKSILFSALLYLNFPDPEAKFDILLDYEKKLKEYGFKTYTYRPITAYTLLLTSKPTEVEKKLAKAYEIFREMRKNHPWLTSGDDYPLSILLADTAEPVSSIMAKTEDLYRSLHEAGFRKSNGLQFLSHILSLSTENNWSKAARCWDLYQYFKENKLKVYSSNYGSLGLLTLLEGRSTKVARNVKEVSEYLAENRRFRWLGKDILFLTAATLVSFSMLENMKSGNELIQTNAFITIEALMAAQNAAMLGAACAATAASSGS
ncbi:MAG TPA: DUF4003 domain-containing protein [Peptococcaceae bacterium]|nr:DUF4003 domain-containing protein [Peptococcaceae bacterium]